MYNYLKGGKEGREKKQWKLVKNANSFIVTFLQPVKQDLQIISLFIFP